MYDSGKCRLSYAFWSLRPSWPAPTIDSKQRRASVCPVMMRMNIGRVRKPANARVIFCSAAKWCFGS
jgi:hypothetical protein